MATIAEALTLGLQAHQGGNLQQAEAIYRQVLQADPGNAEALHLLGLLAHQVGRQDLAIEHLRQALALQPQNANFHFNLGVVYQAVGGLAEAETCYREAVRLQPVWPEALQNLGLMLSAQLRSAEAEACFREALRLRPDYDKALLNLGLVLRHQGRLGESEACFREVVRLAPDSSQAHNNLGGILLDRRRFAEAETSFRKALRLQPDYSDAYSNLGVVLHDQGRLDEAVACYAEAIRLRPDFPQAHNNLGNARHDQGRYAEAEACCREALRLKPSYPQAHNNLGAVLRLLGRVVEAEVSFREALRLDPGYAEAHNNLGQLLNEQGQFAEAEACLEEALRLRPDYAEAHWNRSLLWLLQGDYRRGWPEYEWRWRRPGTPARSFQQPLWDGSALAGRTILLHAEQGLGDTLQFVRYAALVKQRGGHVVLECQPPLLALLRTAPGIDQLLPRGSPLPPFDVHAPLLSLPGILGTMVRSVPAQVPYLFADDQRLEQWGNELAGGGFKVGIVWQGNPKYRDDRRRSVPLACFAGLAGVEGVHLFSLQKGAGVEQLAGAGFPVTELGSRLDEGGGAFLDTAAVLRHLDLLVAPNSALVHLAGALGVPAWVALWSPPEWRWLLERDDSPWYPSVRLFRQQQPGDWDGVFRRMADALAALV